MPYTLDKLREAQERLSKNDILEAQTILTELIDIKQRQWDEYIRIRAMHNEQRNLSKGNSNGE